MPWHSGVHLMAALDTAAAAASTLHAAAASGSQSWTHRDMPLRMPLLVRDRPASWRASATYWLSLQRPYALNPYGTLACSTVHVLLCAPTCSLLFGGDCAHAYILIKIYTRPSPTSPPPLSPAGCMQGGRHWHRGVWPLGRRCGQTGCSGVLRTTWHCHTGKGAGSNAHQARD